MLNYTKPRWEFGLPNGERKGGRTESTLKTLGSHLDVCPGGSSFLLSNRSHSCLGPLGSPGHRCLPVWSPEQALCSFDLWPAMLFALHKERSLPPFPSSTAARTSNSTLKRVKNSHRTRCQMKRVWWDGQTPEPEKETSVLSSGIDLAAQSSDACMARA